MSNQIKVIDNLSGTILFETTLEKSNDAYAFATMMEEEGLDISIEAQGLPETLIRSLGANQKDISEYQNSIDEEIASHQEETGCATCLLVSESVSQ